ncbi:hypothetical protein TNCV_3168691 [Trichonephila clavipes]|nr:hypothetical protein TNCV_3168691 [Trichonephila clavipes]
MRTLLMMLRKSSRGAKITTRLPECFLFHISTESVWTFRFRRTNCNWFCLLKIYNHGYFLNCKKTEAELHLAARWCTASLSSLSTRLVEHCTRPMEFPQIGLTINLVSHGLPIHYVVFICGGSLRIVCTYLHYQLTFQTYDTGMK